MPLLQDIKFCMAVCVLAACSVLSAWPQVRGEVMPYRLVCTFKTSASDEARSLFFDRNGLMLIGTNSGLKAYDGYNIEVLKSTAASPQYLPNNNITAITQDHDDNIWIGTRNGVVRIDPRTNSRTIYPSENKMQPWANTLLTDHLGRVWKGTSDGLYVFDRRHDRFRRVAGGNAWATDSKGQRVRTVIRGVMSVAEDRRGNIFFGTWNLGLFRINSRGRDLRSYPAVNSHGSVYSLFFDSRQRLWIGSWGYGFSRLDHPENPRDPGIGTYSRGGGSFDTYYKFIEDPVTRTVWGATREGISIIPFEGSLKPLAQYTSCGDQPLRFCNDMATDHQGNIWIETLNDGIVHISTRPSPFRSWNFSQAGYMLPVNSVVSLYTADGRYLWCAMKPYGLALIDLATGQARFNEDIPGFASMPNSFRSNSITSIVRRFNGEIWMANNNFGIAIYHPDATVTYYQSHTAPFLADDYVVALCQARNGVMWVGQHSCLSIAYPNNTGTTLSMRRGGEDISVCDVTHIMEDSQGRIWVSTDNEGIIRITGNAFRPSSLRYRFYCVAEGNFPVNDATACFEDSRHRLWAISNSGGLFLYDRQKDRFESVNAKYNIPADRIFSICEDSQGNLWMTSDNALLRLTLGRLPQLRTFGEGLNNLLFYPNVGCRVGDNLFYASQTGIFYFSSRTILKQNRRRPAKLIVSNILLDDEPISKADGFINTKISKSTPLYTHSITVPAGINKVSVEYALLTYSDRNLIRYAYRLADYDTTWHYQSAPYHRATFENLPSGTYHLDVKAVDSDGQWANLPYRLQIRILPPWWATWWAFAIYLVIVVLALFAALRAYARHIKTENRLRMTVVFTNMAHELLTPLSIISASVDGLRLKAPQYDHDYAVMQNNITRLTRLLRQILEVRKSQAGQLKLQVARIDLADFMCKELQSFEPLANQKHGQLITDLPATPCWAWVDADKVDKIVYNLVSNAFKYSHEGGRVWVSLHEEGGRCVLQVRDEGIGISKQRAARLFTRFLDGDYRLMGTTGTGIGLSLTHDLVSLHHGHIRFETKVGQGTAFFVTLPIHRGDYLPEEISPKDNAQAQASMLTGQPAATTGISLTPADQPAASTILLVEDNVELLNLMRNLLGQHYQVLTARNGQQAWNTIQREKLDLVVTDVMMPVMDGIELTRTIKQSDDYAQLPVVLLTAKTQDEFRDEAFRTGADAFITKPIEMDKLRLRIDNLLENRERMRRKFAAQGGEALADQHVSNPDEVFIQRATACVMEHLANSEYDRESFAKDMCVSSSTLYNKLRELTGHTVVSFVTSIRLQEACRILQHEPSILISELSSRVGFNTPRYFSRCFQKQFGMSVKEWAEAHKHD